VEAINININATEDVFLAFSVMQQTMTEFSGVATEKERLLLMTKAVFRLLKNNAKLLM
jgi:hypothetical protein